MDYHIPLKNEKKYLAKSQRRKVLGTLRFFNGTQIKRI
mgnify:CR=1 FL=1